MIITVGAEKGGVGKTRLSTHIAALAACEGVDVVLLDTDPQGSSTGWARIRGDEKVEPQVNVVVLPAASPARALADLAGRYDLVVVDIGAQNYKTFLESAAISDMVLVPCGPDQSEVESTLKVFDALKEIDYKHPKGRIPAHLVLTRVSTSANARATQELREYFHSEGVPSIFDAVIAQRAAWLTAGKAGRAVHELKGKERSDKAAAEVQAVYDEIKRRITEGEGQP